ncbi:MAG: hypothetical protein MUP82_10445 [Candidatus Marinimicrobia bacterium]|nr:hypothetical protein [Candidatus Neomarinimicrobiota bacterium]
MLVGIIDLSSSTINDTQKTLALNSPRLLFGVVPFFTGRWYQFTPALKIIYEFTNPIISCEMNQLSSRIIDPMFCYFN